MTPLLPILGRLLAGGVGVFLLLMAIFAGIPDNWRSTRKPSEILAAIFVSCLIAVIAVGLIILAILG